MRDLGRSLTSGDKMDTRIVGAYWRVSLATTMRAQDAYQVREVMKAGQCLEFRIGKTTSFDGVRLTVSGASGKPHYAC